jgi:hypothetical protein
MVILESKLHNSEIEMSEPVNAAAFHKPHWLLVAKGFGWSQLDTYFSAKGGMVERNGGIENPNRTRLFQGPYYYRFVDMKAKPDSQQGGGWWLDLDQLMKVMMACPSRGLNLSQMARAFLAVPWEWNHADGIVQAAMKKPVDAYEGRGRPVRPGKTYLGASPVDGGGDYPGNPDVIQLYIPDMKSVWKDALSHISLKPVYEFAREYRNIIRV